jgi:cellulose synthase/poly-beta-1,6-N-acetylglucosamine synthase-like glycosyltransferase
MIHLLITLLLGFNYFVGFYYGIVNLVYTILLSISIFVILGRIKRIKYSQAKNLGSSPEIPPISILLPAYNEEKVVVQAINSVLSLNYPMFEVIVINDGSDDRTLENLVSIYKLRKVDLVYRNIIKTRPVKGFYYNSELPNLIVIDKENGGKADALNCGINASKSPYFCSIDADSLIEKDALSRLITPVMESTTPVIACGGVVRVLNGTKVKDNLVKEIDLPKSMLALFQIVEYLRAFLFGRVGWDALNSILILSGTFSLFNKSAVVSVGGYKRENVTEDMELVLRLHKYHINERKPYKIKFIPDPICWTEVPENLKMLGRQRRRWHLGLIQSIVQYRMLFNPRYGKLGLIILPYYFIFEMLGPIIEILGYIVVPLSYLFGLLSTDYFLLFLFLAIFYGIFLSTIGVFLGELTYRRYPKWSHLFRLLIYGVLENFGYRQMNSYWRFQSIILFMFGRKKWEHVEDKGKNIETSHHQKITTQ